ncbi:2-iminobutanoate/2-iminopropanoate deaminase [Bacilli bacterium PM5-3]|nr:2-iminobutanoate/2-iminopropanoate deaminase [Bacilli bacterium PM5-3]MDH6603296.1 2-iminobutanoate/2-iminopropanoate deaminase [Bacilli bacterium PM5-9]
MTRKNIEIPSCKDMPFPFSLAIEKDGTYYLSAQPAMKLEDGSFVGGDIEAQFNQCMHNLDRVLEAASLTRDNVLKCNIYLTNMDDYAKMNELFRAAFVAPHPARTCVGVAALPLNASIEIEMIAHK